jgi:hypothetical protein
MKECGGMEVSGHLQAPAALPPGKILNAHCIRGWVGPRDGVDAVEWRTISCPWRESNSAVQPIDHYYTDEAILIVCGLIGINLGHDINIHISLTVRSSWNQLLSFMAELFLVKLQGRYPVQIGADICAFMYCAYTQACATSQHRYGTTQTTLYRGCVRRNVAVTVHVTYTATTDKHSVATIQLTCSKERT